MTEANVEIEPVPLSYLVCALPPEHPNHELFAITVERGWRIDRWAVCWRRQYLSVDGTWDDGMPKLIDQEDDWVARHRFDRETALKLAVEQAPKIQGYGGKSAAEILEMATLTPGPSAEQ